MAKPLRSSSRRRNPTGRRSARQGKLLTKIDAAVAAGFSEISPPPLSLRSAPAPLPSPGDREEIENQQSKIEIATEPLPARMLNEFVYCPRLFYYEHVEGVFVHNADTLRGATIHTRVDSGSGAMPAAQGVTAETTRPETQNEVIHCRSVSLGSDRLGVTAKIDLVEVCAAQLDDAAGQPDLFSKREVCPVDYKSGAPREGEDGKELWDADKMQLGLQCLLLRDNGYICHEGIIYYRATKQRVRLEITPELEKWIVAKNREARECAAGPIPPPLVDSPKCPRCSLVTVCLPDETRMLAQRPATGEADESLLAARKSAAGEPRRLIAARDDTRALYLTTPGLFVGRSGEVLQVKEKKELLQEVRVNDLSHVALFGNIQISTAAVQTLCEADVPVTYFSMGGWFYGFTRGHSLKNVFTRVEQFRLARDPAVCLWLARSFVLGKIRNQRTMLMRNHLEPPPPILAKLKNSARTALAAQSLDELLGIEGAAAAFYFQQFNGMIKVEDELADSQQSTLNPQLAFNFDFSGRKRRPPTDPVNAMLSLAYSLLAKDCTIGALAVGFDPYIGFYHQPRFGRPALALDVMEEFRPLIAESAVLTAINNRMISEKDFVRAGRAVNLTAAGRKQFFVAYEQRMSHLITHPIFDYKVTYRRAIELQFRILARYLTGEIDEYVPFMTR
ncbi:MAG: CRISPR-associated endonuclease Cas1 [Chthoniobacterales bacterium]|nr:CRISPR-associated endonuclease Cas1 [Chthoniobacterales bacterium]